MAWSHPQTVDHVFRLVWHGRRVRPLKHPVSTGTGLVLDAKQSSSDSLVLGDVTTSLRQHGGSVGDRQGCELLCEMFPGQD